MTRFGHRLVMLGVILLVASEITGQAEAQKAGKLLARYRRGEHVAEGCPLQMVL